MTTDSISQRTERLFRSGFTYAIGNMIQRFASFFLLPLYTRSIPEPELGILWLLYSAGTVLSTVLALGMNSAIFRFTIKAGSAEERRRVIATALTALLGFTALVVFPLWMGRARLAEWIAGSPDYANHVALTLAGTTLDIALLVPLALLRVEDRAVTFSIVATLRFFVSVALNVTFVAGMNLGSLGVLAGNALTSAAALVFLSRGFVAKAAGRPSAALLRGLLRFGAPLMVASIGATLLDSLDLWILRHLRDLEEVSAYGVAYRLTRVMQVLVVAPFMFAWPTLMWSIEGRPEATRVFARVLTHLTACVSFVALALSLFAPEIMDVMGSATYRHAAPAVPWVAFGLVFSAAQLVLNTGASLTGRTEAITFSVFTALLVNVALNFALIPRFGMYGAAASTFFSYVALAWLAWRFGQSLHPIPYEGGRLARTLLLAAACLFAGIQAWSIPHPVSLLARVVLLGAFPAGILSPFVLTRTERSAIRGALTRARRRLGG